MGSVTLTFTGDVAQAMAILRAVAGISVSDGEQVMAKGGEPAGAQPEADFARLVEFVHLVTDSAVALLRFLCVNAEREFTAADLSSALTLEERDLYGVLGGIGRAWKKTSISPNPFASRWSRSKAAPAWSVSQELASRMKELLEPS